MTVRTVLLDPKPVSTNPHARNAGREMNEHRRAWEQEMERAQLSTWFGNGPLQGVSREGFAMPAANGLRAPALAPAGVGHVAITPAASTTEGHARAREQTGRLVESLQGFGEVAATGTATEAPTSQAGALPGQSLRPGSVGSELLPLWPPRGGSIDPDLVGYPSLPVQGNVAGGFPIGGLRPSDPPASPVPTRATPGAAVRQGEHAPSPSIRLHADWSADGVRLWLGLDSNVQGHMAAILDQVRQCMRAQGVRVLSLACNGQVVEDEAGVPTEYQETQHKEKKPWPSVP